MTLTSLMIDILYRIISIDASYNYDKLINTYDSYFMFISQIKNIISDITYHVYYNFNNVV
jgi:hypothetical protein